jgi:tetraacyldisaccharide 4'-kinase
LAFQLRLVDAIVVNASAPGAGDAVADGLRQRFDGPVLRCSSVVAGDAAWLKGSRVVAWAGIAAPQRFFAMLRMLGADVVETVPFGDHQRLLEADAQRLLALAERNNATLVSTEKDMARLTAATSALADLGDATRVLPIRLLFNDPDTGRLAGLIDRAIKG